MWDSFLAGISPLLRLCYCTYFCPSVCLVVFVVCCVDWYKYSAGIEEWLQNTFGFSLLKLNYIIGLCENIFLNALFQTNYKQCYANCCEQMKSPERITLAYVFFSFAHFTLLLFVYYYLFTLNCFTTCWRHSTPMCLERGMVKTATNQNDYRSKVNV